MDKRKEHIFLLVQSGYSARNFILSDFIQQDNAKITFWSDQDYIAQYDIGNKLVKLPRYAYNGKLSFIQKLKNKAELFYNVKKFNNKNYLSYLIGITKNRSFKVGLKDWLSTRIAKFYATEKGIAYLDQPYYKAIRKTAYYLACKKQLLEHKPDHVFCTHQRASSAVAPMLAARDLGIKTTCFIHSWDNIPKGVQLVKADQYFVWSTYMKEEMIAHYPFINSTTIKVTGTPQFIPYFKEEYRLSREEFLSQFGLEIDKTYVLFSGNDKTTSPNDPVYLADVCKAIQQLNAKEDNYRVLFRPNPIDRNEGFNEVLKNYEGLVVELEPQWFGTDTFLWNQGGPSKKDISLLVNTILHVDLVINMGSTMALDAALLGKPSCYINYDVESDFEWSVQRTYKFIHFKIIKDIDPVFWITNRTQIATVLKEAMENPSVTESGRRLWIERVTKLPILETNKRMWNHLLDTYEV